MDIGSDDIVSRFALRPCPRECLAVSNLDPSESPTRDWLIEAFSTMTRIRTFEKTVRELFARGELPGFVHLSIGQEAVATGTCLALQRGDWILSNHRGHGHCIAKGMSIDGMMAELFGRSQGTCSGLAGSMHIADPTLGVLGTNGIVAAGIPIAAGAALAEVLRGTGGVAVAFFGEGAVAQGAFHEAVNLSAVWRLPLILLCENNGYAEFSRFEETSPVDRVIDRAPAYGIPAVRVNGSDVHEVFLAIRAAVSRARAGEGPTLVEALTHRFSGHYEGDPAKYRKEGLDSTIDSDPLEFAKLRLAESGAVEADIRSVEMHAKREVAKAVELASRPRPDRTSVSSATTYSTPVKPPVKHDAVTTKRTIRYMDAIGEALTEEMDRDEGVILLGIDVGIAGGVYGVTKPLERFGPDRVRNAPISETAIVGAAVGAALAGLRPVVEIMFMDFLAVCMDQLVNQAAKLRFMTDANATVPMVLRTQMGGGRSAGSQHSQSWEGIVSHIPGLSVVMPATVRDAKGLLKAAIRSEDPVVFIENRHLYGRKEAAPPRDEVLEIGRSRVVMPGDDVTVVSWSRMLWETLAAADQVASDNISVEVVDLRTIQPLDMETILTSVEKTSRLLIVHEAVGDFGPGAEIAARVQQEGFASLDAPIMRLTPPFSPVPFAPDLERAYLPSARSISHYIQKLVTY